MFNIETVEDVKLLKELTKSNETERIKALEDEIVTLKKVVKDQSRTIISMRKQDAPLTRREVQELISEAITKKTTTVKAPKKSIPVMKSNKDKEFVITPSLFKHKVVSPYYKIFVQGNTLLHKSKTNHENILPISTVQFLTIVEKFTKGKNKILDKDVQEICDLCEISKHQFAKIYYNLKEGNFFETIETIHSQIKQTSFLIKNGFIFIKDGAKEHNTGIDIKTFKELVSIYANSRTPYLTIYKLSKDPTYKDINPIFLLTILRKNDTVSKAIGEKK